jgi:hypothetical protein
MAEPAQSYNEAVVQPLRFRPRQRICSVQLPPTTSNLPSVLCFSHHKAGSSMLDAIIRRLSEAVGLKFVSIASSLFQRGDDIALMRLDLPWPERGYCYGGFRRYPSSPVPLIKTAKTILLVRDPRDAVVSHYFSVRESHHLPPKDSMVRRTMLARREYAQSVSIDQWVIENCGTAGEELAGYVAQGFLARPNVAIHRYEDVIYRKREWIEEMIRWLGWQVPEAVVDKLLSEIDVFPDAPANDRHVRQVHPGNHRVLLKPETCASLDRSLKFPLEAFGYIRDEWPDA